MSLIDDLENYSLDKTTYINLRWIGIIGQLITINVVAIILKFKFEFIIANTIVLFGVISNIFLFFFL
tara:strand:+ start:2830 stop:3030 length:201 start_codon:yes stop_codon:yes gene_type:complete